jgi:hypothetical protein
MNAVVTDHAVDRLRALASKPAEMAEAGALMRAIDQARDLTELVTLLPGSVQLVRSKKGGLLTVRHGQMRAVIATVPEEPGKMVVVNVYRAGEEEPEGDELRAAAARGEDIAHAG